MAETESESIPQAHVAPPKRRISAIWIVPIIAMLIGGWLTWKTLHEKGPLVTITFRSAEGLEARKTRVKFRDLDVGVVETIKLSDDLSSVIVTARMQKDFTPYLTDATRFWVVRARVTAAGVTGMGTLLSGAYIGVDPIAQGQPQFAYGGLENPPLVTSREAGKRFVLRSPTMGSLGVGVPIYYRQVIVGEVVRAELDASGEHVNVDVFVRSPHDVRVHEGTRFWNTSGFDARVDKDGLHIQTESVVSMVIGGIAFDTPGGDLTPLAPDAHVFPLYPDKQSLSTQVYAVKQRFILYFDGSVRGLTAGASVEFRGIQIGQVVDVRLVYNPTTNALEVPVVIEIEPERIGLAGEADIEPAKRLERLVTRGLRAQLQSGNLLTGALIVDLDIRPSVPGQAQTSARKSRPDAPYPELPTVPTQLEAITASATALLNKLQRVPVEQIGASANEAAIALKQTLDQTRELAASLQKDLVPGIGRTMGEAERMLKQSQRLVGPDSPVNVELRKMLNELTGAARSLRLFADHLERHPEDLIRGRSSP